MPSIPSSPRTPTKRRKSSVDLQITSASLQSNINGSRRSSINRRGSQYSIESSTIQRLATSQEWPSVNGTSSLAEGSESNGLGNLADELAEAFDEDEEPAQENLLEPQTIQLLDDVHKSSKGDHRGDLAAMIPSIASTAASDTPVIPPNSGIRIKHRRMNTQYDGSDYDNDSEHESADGLWTSLDTRLAAVEVLAQRGSEANGDRTDNLVQRFAGSLKELPSQSRVENGVTRSITSHSSLSSHLANQSRLVLNLTHPLVSPLSVPPDSSTIDELLLLLADLVLNLPTPASQCLLSLHSLHTSTRELQSILTQLTDTIYMTRQTSTQASRKLKTASDMVSEIRKESDAREEGVRWIEKGGWDSRLKGRECARVCREVVGGFEEVCNGWRDRITRNEVEAGAA